jgi:hypothetical protein
MGSLRLMLFTTDPRVARVAIDAGVAGLVVDWETKGKRARQLGADTEVNEDGPDDLERLAGLGAEHLMCRVDSPGSETTAQVERALACGATDLLLPMVRHPSEVERFLDTIDGRARAGILVETVEAVDCVKELARFPLTWVYLGLNDLAISRRSSFLFEPLIDGTAERVRSAFVEPAFGLAGVTSLRAGAPIPCALLVAEMARLDLGFSFLRRSFKRDVEPADYASEIQSIGDRWQELRVRTAAEVRRDREALVSRIEGLMVPPEPDPVP